MIFANNCVLLCLIVYSCIKMLLPHPIIIFLCFIDVDDGRLLNIPFTKQCFLLFRCGTILHFSRRLYKKDCKILTRHLSLVVKTLTHSRMNLFHMKILFRITEGKLPHCWVNSVGSFKNGIRSSSCMLSPQYLYSWLMSGSKNMLFFCFGFFCGFMKANFILCCRITGFQNMHV